MHAHTLRCARNHVPVCLSVLTRFGEGTRHARMRTRTGRPTSLIAYRPAAEAPAPQRSEPEDSTRPTWIAITTRVGFSRGMR